MKATSTPIFAALLIGAAPVAVFAQKEREKEPAPAIAPEVARYLKTFREEMATFESLTPSNP